MPTRRDFIRTASTTVIAAAATSVSATPRIRSVTLRDETVLGIGGIGSPYGLTWRSDDRQLVAVVEGAVWPGLGPEQSFASALFSISGEPRNALFDLVPGYPTMSMLEFYREKGPPPYYGGATIAVDGQVYQFVSTYTGPVVIEPDGRWTIKGPSATKLLHSPDNGRSWSNQDGSTPVVRQSGKELSRSTMLFWNEPDEGMSTPVILQMGKDYRDNQDGYVYGYWMGGSPGEETRKVLSFRVPKTGVLDRSAYEYFAGMRADGSARWTRDIEERVPMHSVARGWDCTSVVYNKPLGVYMMAGSAATALDPVGFFFKPSSLGLWTSSAPWGPWRQIYENTAWTPNGVGGAMRTLIAPKWIAADGKSFWLVWTEMQHAPDFHVSFLEKAFRSTSDAEKTVSFMKYYRDYLPNYRFNVQRIDLTTA